MTKTRTHHPQLTATRRALADTRAYWRHSGCADAAVRRHWRRLWCLASTPAAVAAARRGDFADSPALRELADAIDAGALRPRAPVRLLGVRS